MGVADDLARQLDRLTEMLEGGADILASDALSEAMDRFGEIENRLHGELDRFADRFSHTPAFQAAQRELWEAPEPPRRKKKPVPPAPEPKKRGRPRKNPPPPGG